MFGVSSTYTPDVFSCVTLMILKTLLSDYTHTNTTMATAINVDKKKWKSLHCIYVGMDLTACIYPGHFFLLSDLFLNRRKFAIECTSGTFLYMLIMYGHRSFCPIPILPKKEKNGG